MDEPPVARLVGAMSLTVGHLNSYLSQIKITTGMDPQDSLDSREIDRLHILQILISQSTGTSDKSWVAEFKSVFWQSQAQTGNYILKTD